MSQLSSDNAPQESRYQWAELIGQIIDRLVDKNHFQKLTIDVPKAEWPGGKHLSSVQLTINGKIIITSKAYDKNNEDKK